MKTTLALCAVAAVMVLACDRGAPSRGFLGGSAAAPAAMPGVSASLAQRDAFKTADASDSMSADSDTSAADTAAIGNQQIAPSMLIRTAEVSVEVGALDTGITGVRALARRVGGYVADVSVQAGHDQPHSATLDVRVPAARFDEALAGLRPLGTLESVNVSTADVSEEYVDVNARMDNARKLEARLIALLSTHTGKLSDVLAVESELSRVREVIERYEGRIRYLRTRAAVSTISVTVHEPVPVVGERGSGSELAEAFRQSWRNCVRFTAESIAALGVLVPLVVLALVAWLVARRLGVKRLGTHRRPEAPASV